MTQVMEATWCGSWCAQQQAGLLWAACWGMQPSGDHETGWLN